MGRTTSREGTAYHEAGHAVISHHEGVEVTSISIVPRQDSQGHMVHQNPLEDSQLDILLKDEDRSNLEKVIRIRFAGSLAQQEFAPESWKKEHGVYDYGEAAQHLIRIDGSPETAGEIGTQLEEETRQILKSPVVRRCVEELAQSLMKKGTMSGQEVTSLIELGKAEMAKKGSRKFT